MPFLIQQRDFAGRPRWRLFADRPLADHDRARISAPPIPVPPELADAPLDTLIAALTAPLDLDIPPPPAPAEGRADPFPQELDP